jgi:outer membrane immunogenic protein
MMRKLLLMPALASVFASPAFAGALIFEPEPEPVVEVAPAPVAAPAPSMWAGPYIGLHSGQAKGEVDVGDDDDDDDNWFFGAHAGYDYDFGGFVLGGELSYDYLDLQTDFGDIDQQVRLVAKGGYGLGPALVYAKAGGVWMDGDESDIGWVAGGGVEFKLFSFATTRLEYLYHEVDDFDDSGADVTVQTLGLGFNYRF